MTALSLFKITTNARQPFDGSATAPDGSGESVSVSAFLTVQSLTNFAAMTGAIAAAWFALRRIDPFFSALWIPYAFALLFGVVSIAISWDGLSTKGKPSAAAVISLIFVALINSLVLASAVVGAGTAIGGAP